MLSALATGTLVTDPAERTSRTGSTFVIGTLRVPSEDDAIFVSIIAFRDSAKQALMALAKGDTAAVVGTAKMNSYTKDGEERHGLQMIADQVLTAYMLDKRRKASTASDAPQEAKPAPAPRTSIASRSEAISQLAPASGLDDLADDLPF
jgi:single-stranded DNA-binding protein